MGYGKQGSVDRDNEVWSWPVLVQSDHEKVLLHPSPDATSSCLRSTCNEKVKRDTGRNRHGETLTASKVPHSLSYSHLSYSFSRWRQPSYSWFCGWIQQPHFPLRSSSLDKRGLHTTSIQQLPDDLITKTMCHVQNSLRHLSFRRCLVRERL